MPLNENNWFTEVFEDRTAFSVKYSEKLFDQNSDYQSVQIYDTEAVGRVLILNGCFMLTEKDAFIYHEMLVHPAMQFIPNVKRVLIIGGGDGGAVTEAVKYPFVESVILCEIDPLVVQACREFLPTISAGLDDPRVKVIHGDGAAFVRDTEKRFDLVLVDSTDPVGPAKALFEVPFYQSVKRVLGGTGAAVFQTESPLFMEGVFTTSVKLLREVFGQNRAHPYFATIPCYPGGLWSFTFCSELHNPRESSTVRQAGPAEPVRYYDPGMRQAVFSAPVFVRRMLA